MTLSGKILYCRKKAGLSQEALAEKLGVSRQAVSKWETGEAVPELPKLLLLAAAFGVTTDWLLSESEPEPEPVEPPANSAAGTAENAPGANWVESVPGVIGRLIRRYGWLYGVYTALAGLGLLVIGAIARGVSRSMERSFFGAMDSMSPPFGGYGGFSDFGGAFPDAGGAIWYDSAGNIISSPSGSSGASAGFTNPVAIVGTVVIVIGVLLLVAGIVLAVVLKKRGNTE